MTLEGLEDERADLMDAIDALGKAIDALAPWQSEGLETIIDAKGLLEERKAELNIKINALELRERLTGWDI